MGRSRPTRYVWLRQVNACFPAAHTIRFRFKKPGLARYGKIGIIFPSTLLNLNPCLDNPAEIETCGKSGCTSRMIAKRPAMISLTNWELRVRLFIPIPKSSRYPHKYTI